MKAKLIVAIVAVLTVAAVGRAEVDLLSLVDIQRDARVGTWHMHGSELWTSGTPSGTPAKLEIPYHPPQTYDLFAEITLTEPDCFAWMLPFEGEQISLHFISYGRWSSFGGGAENKLVDLVLPAGDYQIAIRVRDRFIDVDLNGQDFMVHTGGPEDIMYPQTDNDDPLAIGLVAYRAELTYRTMTIVPEPATLSLLALLALSLPKRGGLAVLRRDFKGSGTFFA